MYTLILGKLSFPPVCLLYSHPEHFTSDPSGHQISGHQAILCDVLQFNPILTLAGVSVDPNKLRAQPDEIGPHPLQT